MICTFFEKRTRITHDHSNTWIRQNEPKTDLDLNHNLLEQVEILKPILSSYREILI